MSPLWIILAVLVGFVVMLRLRRKGRKGGDINRPYSPRIEGYVVTTFLHPEMSLPCLFDHGLQYGRGFRRKEGPVLPHDEKCRCSTARFAHSGSEVFNGALRDVGAVGTEMQMSQKTAKALVNMLMEISAQALPETFDEFYASIPLEGISRGEAETVKVFLQRRFDFLKATGEAQSSS